MKRLNFAFAIVLLAFVSCIQVNFEEENYGTVVFDLAGVSNLRAIDQSTGLPILSNSKMKVIVEASGNRAKVKEFGEKDKKQYKESFPIGLKVKFTVIVMTEGSRWKGSIKHTVASGDNSLNVKLKRAVFSLEPLKFKLSKVGIHGKFELGFLENGKRSFFNEEVSGTYTSMNEIPPFCRDQVGRTYVVYNDSTSLGDLHFERYTSEGNRDTSFVSPSFNSQDSFKNICSDHKTGNIFVACENGGLGWSVSLIKEKPSAKKDITPSPPLDRIQSMAVYNNIIAIAEGGNNDKLCLYNFNGEDQNISKIAEKDITELLKIKIKGNPSAISHRAKIMDCYMNNKDIYLLYNCYSYSYKYISVGGILKVSYSKEKDSVKLGEPVKLMGRGEYVLDGADIVNVEDDKNELYGPWRFVGLYEDVLYIADDGVVYEYGESGNVKVRENKNRLLGFNLKNGKISTMRKDNTVETWMPETE